MTAPAIAPDPQELYRAEKARRADRVRPEMEAAAAELRRMDALAVEQKKGGRPRGSGMTLGKSAPRWKRTEPEPDAPGRPEWLTPPTPVREDPTPDPSTPMKFEKKCQRSGKTFTASGPAAKYCGKCPACEVAAAGGTPEKKKTPAKRAAAREETPRPPRNTGYRPPTSTPAAPSSGLAGSIEAIKSELQKLDARRAELRTELREALDQLQELAEA